MAASRISAINVARHRRGHSNKANKKPLTAVIRTAKEKAQRIWIGEGTAAFQNIALLAKVKYTLAHRIIASLLRRRRQAHAARR